MAMETARSSCRQIVSRIGTATAILQLCFGRLHFGIAESDGKALMDLAKIYGIDMDITGYMMIINRNIIGIYTCIHYKLGLYGMLEGYSSNYMILCRVVTYVAPNMAMFIGKVMIKPWIWGLPYFRTKPYINNASRYPHFVVHSWSRLMFTSKPLLQWSGTKSPQFVVCQHAKGIDVFNHVISSVICSEGLGPQRSGSWSCHVLCWKLFQILKHVSQHIHLGG